MSLHEELVQYATEIETKPKQGDHIVSQWLSYSCLPVVVVLLLPLLLMLLMLL